MRYPLPAVSGLVNVCALLACASCAGQTQGMPRLPLVFGNPVPGAPYSATQTLDFEPIAGSTDKPFHAEVVTSRDSAGRTRSEFHYPNQLPTVDVLDFPTHTHYHWTVGDTVVTQSVIPPPQTPPNLIAPEVLPADAPLIEGIPTRHMHSTRGSDEASRYVMDTWYSPEMRLALLSTYERATGKTTYRYTNMKRGEPDAALFLVPAGFTINNPNQAPPPPVKVAADSAPPAATPSAPHAPYMDDPKVGSGADVRRVVDDAVKKAHKAEARKAAATGE